MGLLFANVPELILGIYTLDLLDKTNKDWKENKPDLSHQKSRLIEFTPKFQNLKYLFLWSHFFSKTD
jgi:hypothetical protein